MSDDELHLTIGGLHYTTQETDVSRAAERWGTGSSFLARLCAGEVAGRISIKVVHPPRFSLPADVTRPVVLFAGGTGISPMRGLIDERMQTPGAGETWLFFGTRTREDFYYQRELEPLVAAGQAVCRDRLFARRCDGTLQPTARQLSTSARANAGISIANCSRTKTPDLLWDLLRSPKDGGQGAYFYLCGRTAFASTILDTIKQIIARFADGATTS